MPLILPALSPPPQEHGTAVLAMSAAFLEVPFCCAGMKVLADGGNAVDAAVATALCQGVLNPMASGLGGGGFMVIQTAQGETQVIDGREVAPAAASERMFAGDKADHLSMRNLEHGSSISGSPQDLLRHMIYAVAPSGVCGSSYLEALRPVLIA